VSADIGRYEKLFRQEWFSCEELGDLLDLSTDQIRRAVFEGRLRATVIDGHIVEITRHDALKWLADEERGA
jgi:hypothetical protein